MSQWSLPPGVYALHSSPSTLNGIHCVVTYMENVIKDITSFSLLSFVWPTLGENKLHDTWEHLSPKWGLQQAAVKK